MKTATIPSLRVSPKLREEAEQLLNEGETLSSFVEQSIREGVERRKFRREFIARGLRSRDAARSSGNYVSSDAVISNLEKLISVAKTKAEK